nr:retrovirus-related Pol polyprotein from transposon TNT 1-94 [Tanacetum cinerariifolium]
MVLLVFGCLSTVVQLKVQHLYIRLPDDIFWELFKTCDTLVELTLTGGFRLVVPKQADMLFPSLKKLVLINVAYSSVAFTNLISGCPVLEELIAERKFVGEYDSSVVIDAPKLEYLYISDESVTSYILTETLSLVEAHISYDSRYVGQLLTRLSSAKILTLTNTTIQPVGYYHGYSTTSGIKSRVDKVPFTSTLVDPTSSNWARPVLMNARLAVKVFNGTGHFGMWQSDVLDALFQQGLDIAVEESKPEDVEERNWLACGTIRSCLSREQ